jgi:hypothetical protein
VLLFACFEEDNQRKKHNKNLEKTKTYPFSFYLLPSPSHSVIQLATVELQKLVLLKKNENTQQNIGKKSGNKQTYSFMFVYNYFHHPIQSSNSQQLNSKNLFFLKIAVFFLSHMFVLAERKAKNEH